MKILFVSLAFIITVAYSHESLWVGGKELNLDALDESRAETALNAVRLQGKVIGREVQGRCTNLLLVFSALAELPELYTLYSLVS